MSSSDNRQTQRAVQQSGAYLVIYIIVALVLKAALEAVVLPQIQMQDWTSLTALQWGQAAVFFLMTLRFYLGATRYVSTEPQNLHFVTSATNLIFAFLLFCAFYATALAVVQPSSYYLLMVVVHVIDATWFATAALCIWHLTDSPSPGDIKRAATFRIMATFFMLSFVTIAYAFISYTFLFRVSLTDETAEAAHWSFLAVLSALSLLDFALLHEYYFDSEKWREKNSVPEQPTPVA
jgi:hypothetical protein